MSSSEVPASIIDCPTVVNVEASAWQATCLSLIDAQARFLTLFATDDADVIAVFADGEHVRALVCAACQGIGSLVDSIPAVNWDEREAHDLYGVNFAGHEPLRSLVHHIDDPAAWTLPTTGPDTYQVAVGPTHAGVIESGHFRFQVVGERILHLNLRLFYKHRGLERAAQGHTWREGLPFVGRACAACWVSNALAYAHACESLAGFWPSSELSRVRTILLELERVYNHLHDLSAACTGVGFAIGAMAFAAMKERVQRLNMALCGHRFLFGSIEVGGSPLAMDSDSVRAARAELATIRDDACGAWRDVLLNDGVQERWEGIGVVKQRAAVRLGAVGPTLRGAGVSRDVRTHSSRLYYEGFHPAVPARAVGDVASRIAVRAVELDASLLILDQLLDRPVVPLVSGCEEPADGLGIGRVESPRGETVCAVQLQSGLVSRVHLRTGSYANWPSVARATAGNIIADFPLINKSFELCYACADR